MMGIGGATGAGGTAGRGGAPGAGGASGRAGTAGASGASGVGGATGTTGASGASGVGGATGTGGIAGASGSAGSSAGGCNSVVNSAPVVGEFQATANPPVPLGGTIVDGTYYLSESISYTGPNGASGPTGMTIQDTLVITNAASGIATVEEVTSSNAAPDERTSFTFTPVGTMATAAVTCPTPDSLSFGYTATATTFMPILGNSASLYIKQ